MGYLPLKCALDNDASSEVLAKLLQTYPDAEARLGRPDTHAEKLKQAKANFVPGASGDSASNVQPNKKMKISIHDSASALAYLFADHTQKPKSNALNNYTLLKSFSEGESDWQAARNLLKAWDVLKQVQSAAPACAFASHTGPAHGSRPQPRRTN